MRAIHMHIAQLVLIAVVVLIMALILGRSYGHGEGIGIGLIDFARNLLGMEDDARPLLISSATEVTDTGVVTNVEASIPRGYVLVCDGNEYTPAESDFEGGNARVDCTMTVSPPSGQAYGRVVYEASGRRTSDDASVLLRRFEFEFIRHNLPQVTLDSLGFDRDESSMGGYSPNPGASINEPCRTIVKICDQNQKVFDVCGFGHSTYDSFEQFGQKNCKSGFWNWGWMSVEDCAKEFIEEMKEVFGQAQCTFSDEVFHHDGLYLWVPGLSSPGVIEPILLDTPTIELRDGGSRFEPYRSAILTGEEFSIEADVLAGEEWGVDPRLILTSRAGDQDIIPLETESVKKESSGMVYAFSTRWISLNDPDSYSLEIEIKYVMDGNDRIVRHEFGTVRVVSESPYEIRIIPLPADLSDQSADIREFEAVDTDPSPIEAENVVLGTQVTVGTDAPLPDEILRYTIFGPNNENLLTQHGTLNSAEGDGSVFEAFPVIHNPFSEEGVYRIELTIESVEGHEYVHDLLYLTQPRAVCSFRDGVSSCPEGKWCVASQLEDKPFCFDTCVQSGVEVWEVDACCSGRVSSRTLPARCI